MGAATSNQNLAPSLRQRQAKDWGTRHPTYGAKWAEMSSISCVRFEAKAGYGGANNRGTVFKITASGTLTTLYSFCNLESCADGALPYAGLVLATNGNFYRTTEFGGKYSYGAIFEITPSGSLTTLYSFCPDKNPCPDGARPSGNLIQAADGRFYGTTQAGGANHNNACATEGCGTVFAFAGGGLTTLYSFCAQSGCTDGQTPNAGVIQATNGYLYGTTEFGGANSNNGTVFKITTSGTLTTLYSFCSVSGCLDGQGPTAGLLQATDGNLYGTTSAGGRKGAGTIYEMNLSGELCQVTKPKIKICKILVLNILALKS